jgi:hypothetical protein
MGGRVQSRDILFLAASGRTMPVGFTEYNFRKNGEHLGIMVFMSNSGESRMALATKDKNPGLSIGGNEGRFNSDGKIAMQVAAAFFDLGEKTQGALVENGTVLGRHISKDGGSALVVIDGSGKPKIRNIGELGSSAEKYGFLKEAEQKGWSVFQQLFLIENGKAADISKFKVKGQTEYCLRFLVEMQGKGGASSYGIVSFERNISLSDAVNSLASLKMGPGGKLASVKNAVYLDSGAAGYGLVYYDDGASRPTGKTGDRFFSNFIVLYSKQDKKDGFFEPARK